MYMHSVPTLVWALKRFFFLQISQMCITYEKKNIGPEIFGMVKQWDKGNYQKASFKNCQD